jgi:DNA-binding beta-propeller fold protein YncE
MSTKPRRRSWWLAVALASVGLCAGEQSRVSAGAPAPRGGSATLRAIVGGYSRGRPFKVPAGLCFDGTRREIYVADRGNHKIAVFDEGGLYLRGFLHHVSRPQAKGKPRLAPGEPKGLAVNSRGDIYVLDDLDDAVDVLDYRGRSVGRITAADLLDPEEPPLKTSEQVRPSAVAVDQEDRVYVATTGSRCQIVVLDAEGRVLRRFGRRGTEPGTFISINALSVDAQGRILVTDAQGVPVQCLSPEGEVLVSFGAHGPGPENFSLPNGVVRDGNGDIWVADALRQVVKRFDANGKVRDLVGGLGRGPGQMFSPVALAGDGARFLVVLEKDGARFQTFGITS